VIPKGLRYPLPSTGGVNWQARAEKAEAELADAIKRNSEKVAKLSEVMEENAKWREAVAFFVKAEDEAAEHGGLKDNRDNDGQFFQSQWMECLLDKCRSLLSREG
jgi:hypothetical protein